MKVLIIIIGSLFLLLSALLLLRIRFDVILKDEILIRMNILGIKFQLYPEKEKKVSPKKFKKGYPSDKKDDDSKKQSSPPSDSHDEFTLEEKISTVISLLKLLFSRLFKHLRLDISRIVVIVGAKDAASCAISYGIVSQSVAYLLEFLDNNLSIYKRRRGQISVLCDFVAEKTVYDIFISTSLNIWQILDIAISLVYNYFKGNDIFNLKKRFGG